MMTALDSRLHMIKMHLSTPAAMKLGREKRLPLRQVDVGYLVHCQIGEIFGDDAPSPFSLQNESGRWLEVLAYSRIDGAQLRHRAEAFADPTLHAMLDWDRFADKPMPEDWPDDSQLGFTIRVCPVVRAAEDTEHYTKGSEVDVFLTRSGPPDEDSLSREEVYQEWFREQIERRDGAEILSSRLDRFQLGRFIRRTHGSERKARTLTRPDTTVSGTLRVTDSDAFNELLGRGVGRHRAFGFGMLLLMPAAS